MSLVSCLTWAPCVRRAAAVVCCGWQGTGQPAVKALCLAALQPCVPVKPASLQPPVTPPQTSPAVPLRAFQCWFSRSIRYLLCLEPWEGLWQCLCCDGPEISVSITFSCTALRTALPLYTHAKLFGRTAYASGSKCNRKRQQHV